MVRVEYESDRLYGARRTFGASSRADGFLFGVRPDVWPLDAPILPLVLPDLPNLGPPPNLRSSRPQAQNQTIFYGTQPLKTYNPSGDPKRSPHTAHTSYSHSSPTGRSRTVFHTLYRPCFFGC